MTIKKPAFSGFVRTSFVAENSTQPPELPVKVPPGYTRKRVEKSFWPKLKRVAGSVPGVADILALYYYMNSDLAPAKHKVSIVLTLAYFIMPLDALPDFIGALGYVDDVAVALGLIRFIGSGVMKPYRIHARKWLRGEVPRDEKKGPAEAVVQDGAK